MAESKKAKKSGGAAKTKSDAQPAKKPAPKQSQFDTTLAASAAAKMVASGAAPAASTGDHPESAAFKKLKESLNKPSTQGISNFIQSTAPTKKGGQPFAAQNQTRRNQTFGAGTSIEPVFRDELEGDVKAVRVHRFGGPEVLTLEEVPDPQPGSGQVLVRLAAVGVNPVETYVRSGKYGPRAFPYTPGSDSAGTVEAVGENVTRFKPGDRVYTASTVSGAYAQKALCSQQTVFPLPPHVTFAEGAALGVPYATAHRGLFHRARVLAGETLLVHGASGGVGLAAVQLARAIGCTVIGTAGTEEGRALVAREGAHFVLDHRADDHLTKVMDLTAGKGVDLILEMAAHVNLGKDLEVLAQHGRVIVIGNRGPVQIDARETMRRDADIRGMSLMNATESELIGVHAAIIAGLENHSLRPIIARELPLAEVARAHDLVLQDGTPGKIVMVP